METKLVIFLAFLSATVITNTVLIWFAYKAFANVTSRVTEAVSEFESSSSTKAWISSMQTASEQAARLSGIAKEKMQEFDPVLNRMHTKYNSTLVSLDSQLAEMAEGISDGARQVRDTVAKPAFSVIAFIAGLSRTLRPEEDDEY